ncbi:MAG: hypothetical protein JWQ08_1171 [Deinococcus sp.]|nr:hypothetical protein [Deinococcus sp.]
MTEGAGADGWMLEAPRVKLPASALDAFQVAFETRDLTHLPPGVPRWLFLEWLAREDWLLHGSPRADIQTFEARTPHDLGDDPFSKRTGVFASSDGLLALMYALRDRTQVKRMLNMALQRRESEGQWSTMRYFLSLAPHAEKTQTDGRALLIPRQCVCITARRLRADAALPVAQGRRSARAAMDQPRPSASRAARTDVSRRLSLTCADSPGRHHRCPLRGRSSGLSVARLRQHGE